MNQTGRRRVAVLRAITLTAAWLASAAGANARAEGRDSAPPRVMRITVDYVNAEVTDVVRALAAQSNANVAMNPSVKGQVTVHLRDKTLDEALGMVTNLTGLGLKRVEGTWVIAPRAEMRQTLERMGETRRYTLAHIADKAAVDLVQNAFADVTAKPQGREVALIGAPEDLDAAEKLLKRNDIDSPELARTTRKVEMKNRPAKEVAAALAKMSPAVSVETAGSAVVLTGKAGDVETARANAELIDVPGQPAAESRIYKIRYAPPLQLVIMLQQVSPEVQVIPGPDSYTPTRPQFSPLSGQFVGNGNSGSGAGGQQNGQMGAQGPGSAATGISVGGAGGGPATLALFKNARTLILKGPAESLDEAVKVLRAVDVAPRQMMIEAKVVDTSPEYTKNLGVEWQWNQFQFFERGQQIPTGGAAAAAVVPSGPLGFGSYLRAPFNPIATLNAMITNKQAKLLASPQTAVVDDQDASVFIGDTLRFQSLAQSSPTTGNQFTVVEVPVGIILLVHPRVNDDGYITLRVHPVVSTVTGFTLGLPQTSSREAETVVRVKDGDTLVMAGLIRDEDVRQMSKIPFLGDLPILGNLFKNELRSHRRSEVMLFLTIKLIPQTND